MKDTEFNIRIANIRELTATNNISRWEMLRYCHDGIAVSLKSRFIPNPDKKQISLVIGTCYTSLRNMLRRHILCYNIEVVFDIDPYPDDCDDTSDRIKPPAALLSIMYGSAIGALRGMLALRLSNTFLHDYPLPLINISALVSEQLYGTPVSEKSIPLTDFIYN